MENDPKLTSDPAVQADSETEESFVARWSRRKIETRREPEQNVPNVRPEPDNGLDSVDEALPQPIIEPTDADMPPLEALDEHSDYSGFLSPKVSEELRRRALRKLFQMPKFNLVDGLDDYAEDYRSFEALGDIITADMRYQMERQAQKVRDFVLDESREQGEHQADPNNMPKQEGLGQETARTVQKTDQPPGTDDESSV
jgi:hypothetical protein